MNTINIQLDHGAHEPVRAHAEDAGLDIRAPHDVIVRPYSSVVIDTGVHIEIPRGFAGILVSKSGLNIKYDITSTGLIDAGYTGSIVIKLYNNGYEPYCVKCKDKISQLIIVPVATPKVNIVDRIDGGERGDAGFGSTGRA